MQILYGLLLAVIFPFVFLKAEFNNNSETEEKYNVASVQTDCDLKLSVTIMRKKVRGQRQKLKGEHILRLVINDTTKTVPLELQSIISNLWVEDCELNLQVKGSGVTVILKKGDFINLETPKNENEGIENDSYFYLISLSTNNESNKTHEIKKESSEMSLIEKQIAARSDFERFLDDQDLKVIGKKINLSTSNFIESISKTDNASSFVNMYKDKITKGYVWYLIWWHWKDEFLKSELISRRSFIIETDENFNIIKNQEL